MALSPIVQETESIRKQQTVFQSIGQRKSWSHKAVRNQNLGS